MEKELQGLKEEPKAKKHVDQLKATFKKVLNWKTPGHDGMYEYWF